MESLYEFFQINRPVVLFVYGLTFFMMGFAIFLQSRRHSRLRLARDLYWLAAFGILHGIHEWGIIFIPIQATYTPPILVDLLQSFQTGLLTLSFLCLFMFGAVSLERRYPWLRGLVAAAATVWITSFFVAFYLLPTVEIWHRTSNIWARYLLGFPGALIAAYALRYQSQLSVIPRDARHIYQTLRVAGGALLAYAFLGGLVVADAPFFPANVLNESLFEQRLGVPVELFRSLTGIVLAVAIIRALEVFEIEFDALIEGMEIERIQSAERERIGQQIHDGAIQGVYSASLILEATLPHVAADSEAARRLDQARHVLKGVNRDLRSYMVSLRGESPVAPLVPSLRDLIADPRFRGLLDIELDAVGEPNLSPERVQQLLAIVQEALSNTLRHAYARRATIRVEGLKATLRVQIGDDGHGFAADAVRRGYGLRSMEERARQVGGRLDIASAPGKGTTITLTLPMEEKS